MVAEIVIDRSIAVVGAVATLVALGNWVHRRLRTGRSTTVGYKLLSDLVNAVHERWTVGPGFLSMAARRHPLRIAVARGPDAAGEDLLSVCHVDHFVLIRDNRGSGKSTALRQAATDLAAALIAPCEEMSIADWLRQTPLPLYIYLARWTGLGSFEHLVQREFQAQYRTTASVASLVIEQSSQLHLFLDGFDEVHAEGRSARLDRQRRADLAQAIATFCGRHEDARVVIASTVALPTRAGAATEVRLRRPGHEIATLAGADERLRSMLERLGREKDVLPLEADLACDAYEHGEDPFPQEVTTAGDGDRGAEVTHRTYQLLARYSRRVLAAASAEDRRLLLWLTSQLSLRGDSAIFRPSELDPFWLPRHRDRNLAFALMGCIVMVVPGVVVATAAPLVGLPLWTSPLILVAAVSLGANYVWVQRFVYAGIRRRRPQAVVARSFDADRMWVQLANNGMQFSRQVGARMFYGLIGGAVFAALRSLIGGVSSAALGNVSAFIAGVLILCVAEAVGGGAIGTFVAVGVICALSHLGTGPWWEVVLKTGVPAGISSILVFYAAELGEVAAKGSASEDTTTTLRRNVFVQARFEFIQWLLVGALFGAMEAALFWNSRWFFVTGATVLAAGFFYGVIGGAFPLLLFATTQGLLRRSRIVVGSLDAALARVVELQVLQREPQGLGVRFVHPTIADAIRQQLEASDALDEARNMDLAVPRIDG